jgi:hypothetical protein
MPPAYSIHVNTTLTCEWTISQEIKVQRGQLRYQSIENIHTSNRLSLSRKPFIFTDVAGLQSEKMQKRGH